MFARIRRYAREQGVRNTVLRAFEELCRQTFSTEEVTVLVKDLDSISEPPRRPSLEVVSVDRDQLLGLSRLNRRRRRSDVDRRFRHSLERGFNGFVGLRGADVLCCCWCADGADIGSHPDFDRLGPVLPIEAGDAYLYDLYVLPDVRRRGLGLELLYRVETTLGDRGYNRIWLSVDRDNLPAQRLYRSRDYQTSGHFSIRRILFRRRSPTERHATA